MVDERHIIGVKGLGDPFILNFGRKYYLYYTDIEHGAKGFCVRQSIDLKNWSAPKRIYEIGDSSYGDRDFWAPQVVYRDGKFIMHYSCRGKQSGSLRICAAVSENPDGIFADISDKKPLFDFGYSCIDGTVFTDGEKNYLFYSRDCSENIVDGIHESQIYAVELTRDLTGIVGSPVLIIRPDREYEFISGTWRWNEAPSVIKHGELYYLTYSTNYFKSRYYSVCYAVSAHLLYGWTKPEHNILLQFKEGVISGPGHNSFFSDNEGKTRCAYHIHSEYGVGGEDRQLCIGQLVFSGDEPKII